MVMMSPVVMSPVVHFEMPAEDTRRMASFYEKTFGWKTQMLGPDMGDYVLVTTAESDVKPGAPAGAINGGFFPKKPDWPAQYPSIVIGVDDIESAMRRVGKEGGKVLGEPMQIPGVGRYVSFFDTEGNRVSMLQPDREPRDYGRRDAKCDAFEISGMIDLRTLLAISAAVAAPVAARAQAAQAMPRVLRDRSKQHEGARR